MRERVGIFVQARSNSERLPGKIYAGLPEAGRLSMLEHIYRRLSRVASADVLAVLIPEGDEALRRFCGERGLSSFAGSEQDVRSRFRRAAEHLGVDVVVRATADNPLTDPGVADETIQEIRRTGADLLSFSNLPLGIAVEAFRRRALNSDSEVALPEYEEHVSLHIKHHPEVYDVVHLDHALAKFLIPGTLPRLTVDTRADLSVVRRVFRKLGPDASVERILDLWKLEPDLFDANREVAQRTFARRSVSPQSELLAPAKTG